MSLNEEQKNKAIELRDKLAKEFDSKKAEEFIENMSSKVGIRILNYFMK